MREYLLLGGPRDGQRIDSPPGPVLVGALCKTAIELAGYRPLIGLHHGARRIEVLVWAAERSAAKADCTAASGALG